MGTAKYGKQLGLTRFNKHFTEVEPNKGDTLVFIDLPNPTNDKTPVDGDDVPLFRGHSEKLKATGSSRFEDMFQPTYQNRIQRLRKLVNKLPEGVKYVLDLTPPSEGEEMAFQVTELSLTPGIIKGSSSRAQIDWPFFYVNAPLHIPNYCPIRHCNGIVHLLRLIEGMEPIDSAPRLLTIVALAKIWDCVSAVRDPAIQWLLREEGSKFIEAFPEEAIIIGGIFQSPQITRATFRILVSELALEPTATYGTKTSVTIFGRRKGDPGHEFGPLIQHAARAFVERMTSRLAELNSLDVFEAWKIPDYMKILKIEKSLKQLDLGLGCPALEIIGRLKTMLRLGLNSGLNSGIGSQHFCSLSNPDSNRATYVESGDFRLFHDIYRTMTPLQRLLTSRRYKELEISWLNWASHADDAENSYRSTAKVVESLGHEMGKISELCKRCHAWSVDDNSPELMKIFSEDFLSAPLLLQNLDLQVRRKLGELGGTISDNEQDLQMANIEHLLLTLTDNETKFLPPWAGGLNDGTGSVFENQLPPADKGPDGPGPAHHTSITMPSVASSRLGFSFEDISALRIAGSATAASVDVLDNISTICHPDHFVADDALMGSESFHLDHADYYDARHVPPSARQRRQFNAL
ncbi:hypothetical protein CCM_04290 [Cordyceps militaris CM01]|uniref:Uncharacterized protein n=1 Tax=Cordyceps militaris (strain CM01) TaxID=983644 RepID=G3JE93_CORMM|nr:uncharacterized protein CCM_04290 [Cordyceps militaris CM01]EGX92918.1 hypothetical protein CCM_04290 [Cordyceps militaris CM01]